MFIAVLFTIAEIWKQPKYPSTRKVIKKMQYIYREWTTYYTVKKENENLPFASHGWAQRVLCLMKKVREMKILYNITYMWNIKKIQTNLYIRQK